MSVVEITLPLLSRVTHCAAMLPVVLGSISSPDGVWLTSSTHGRIHDVDYRRKGQQKKNPAAQATGRARSCLTSDSPDGTPYFRQATFGLKLNGSAGRGSPHHTPLDMGAVHECLVCD